MLKEILSLETISTLVCPCIHDKHIYNRLYVTIYISQNKRNLILLKLLRFYKAYVYVYTYIYIYICTREHHGCRGPFSIQQLSPHHFSTQQSITQQYSAWWVSCSIPLHVLCVHGSPKTTKHGTHMEGTCRWRAAHMKWQQKLIYLIYIYICKTLMGLQLSQTKLYVYMYSVYCRNPEEVGILRPWISHAW